MDAVEAADSLTAAARLTLVARRCGVIEIITAGTLEQIAAGRRCIAQLRRGAGEDGARQKRKVLFDARIVGDSRIAGQCADPQAAVGQFDDLLQRQTIDIDNGLRLSDVIFDQVDEIGSAGQQLCLRIGHQRGNRIADGFGARVGKGFHSAASRWRFPAWSASTVSMASAMFV